MTAHQLPDGQGEIAELDLLRLLEKQRAEGRLQVAATPLSLSLCQLLIDARTQLETLQRLPVIEALAVAQKTSARPVICALIQPVAVGTTDQLQQQLDARYQAQGEQVPVVCLYWPAFIEAGRALESFTRAGRVIICSVRAEAIELILQLMLPFNRSKDALMVMTAHDA